MKTVVIASENRVKVRATRAGFRRAFAGAVPRVVPVSVSSGVRNQPRSDAETLKGAECRAAAASRRLPAADFWVGIEGGIEQIGENTAAYAWVVVRGGGRVGRARTGTFFLPAAITRLLREGRELGEADDILFGLRHSKRARGAVGILTRNAIDRAALYEEAVILALVPFVNPDLYPADVSGA